MNGSFDAGFFGPGPRRPGMGRAGAGMWEAMDQLKDAFEQRLGTRMGKGDVRAAILALLAEQPMHGYQIIHEIEERSGGLWKPSPGSVYPTLQMLADEGLIESTEAEGRKTYELTDAGREAMGDADEGSAPWEMPGMKDAARATALPKAGMKLAQAAAQVASAGTREQVDEAVAVLEDARRRLYSILAED